MPSSVLTVPSGVATGVISDSQKPLFRLSSARFWLRTANSSWSARLTSMICATFSAVWPMARYMSGRPSRGVQVAAPPSARSAERASASANTGFFGPSAIPKKKRLAVSTPPARNTSPSPALMAWAAMRIVMSDDEQ